jgi:cyclopropane fatty-acyl-phospholipid synthase-like methyltransferase
MYKLLESEKTILELKSESSGFFDEIYQDPEYKVIFQNSMNARTFMVTKYIDEHVDMRNYSAVIDIGGGNGSVLAFFMKKYFNIRGAVYDLPEMQELSENYISSLGLIERFSFVQGDFFESVPLGFDVHILKNILHDWNDEKCKIILRNIRNSLSSGQLIIIEYIVDNVNLSNTRGKRDDINMMVILNAAGRTELEYRALLNETGFEIKKITLIKDIMMVLQAIPI